MDDKAFLEALQHNKIPVLVLDQKWHRLFAISGKPQDVKDLEVEENELLARQGKLNTELKELKQLKTTLMKNIVEKMDASGANDEMNEDKRLIDETNEKIAADEDELLDLPKMIKEKNDELMMATMRFSYDKLRTNTEEINQISDWIRQFRIELKKNIIRKQNREINNREIYSYMHDVFGKDVLNLFDVHYEEDQKATEAKKSDESSSDTDAAQQTDGD